jgi:hypothetical protein
MLEGRGGGKGQGTVGRLPLGILDVGVDLVDQDPQRRHG